MSSIKLSPAIKRLLATRNPNSFPGPSRAPLTAVLQRTRADAQKRGAEDGWLVLAACALLTSNVPPAFAHLYRVATRPQDAPKPADLATRVRTAALIREAALKSTIFVGVPRVILSLAAFHSALEDDVHPELRAEAHPDRLPSEDLTARGQALWQNIYAPHDVKLAAKLGSYHPDFIAFIIESYGAVLSPLPPTTSNAQGNLSRALGSVVGISCLRAESRVGPQLISHVFGLLKARTWPGVLSAEDKWLGSDEGTQWVIETTDAILDVVEKDKESAAWEEDVKTKL
ncbi:hypothetical protein PENSPDRAFT_686639 [Peniophora sp. CONT]|nr:hypothetical protein PENSPDRAFT_686639 [Peniophora sp. CONT]